MIEDTGIFSGPCAGDDGGPLTVEDQGVRTLVGLVSGGIGCGTGVPSWYTKVRKTLILTSNDVSLPGVFLPPLD